MRVHLCVVRLLLVASALSLCVSATVAEAGILFVCDLDSLAYLSSNIVEGEVTRSYAAEHIELLDFKVTRVHKGELQEEQTIPISWSYLYAIHQPREFNPRRLAEGDRLVLFLTPGKTYKSIEELTDILVYGIVMSGVKLIHKDHVFNFAQGNNPGPYVTEISEEPDLKRRDTLERFREKLQASLRDEEEMQRLIAVPDEELDLPRLLELMNRPAHPLAMENDFTARIALRLMETHDPAILGQGLAVARSYHDRSVLYHGFGTPDGRDFLLAKVVDAEEAMPARVLYSLGLEDAGMIYRRRFITFKENNWVSEGELDENNSHYLTRIAQAVAALGKEEELCRNLLRQLDYWAKWSVRDDLPQRASDVPNRADFAGALAVLVEFYKTKPPEAVQFDLEMLSTYLPGYYEQLHSSGGPLISLLQPAKPRPIGAVAKPESETAGRSFACTYRFKAVEIIRDKQVQQILVLVHLESNQRYEFPAKFFLRGHEKGSGDLNIPLPDDLPAGKYHSFLELKLGDELLSTGHGFVTEL